MKYSSRMASWILFTLILQGCASANDSSTSANVDSQRAQPSQESPGKNELLSNLTSGSWAKRLGQPPFVETVIYTFHKDATYSMKLLTDHPVEPVTGEWELTEDKDGRYHLVLKNKQEKHYWLPQDSIIEYDKKSELLVISGKSIRNTQSLERMK